MCSTDRGCFSFRSCWPTGMRMRTQSELAQADHSRRSAGGRWFRGQLQRFRRGPTSQAGVSNPATTDGHRPSGDEEPHEECPIVILTFEQNLEKERFCEASRLLMDRENLLFGEITAAEAADKLAADHRTLEKLVLRTVQQSLSLSCEQTNSRAASGLSSALTSAVKAIEQEEEQDRLWKESSRTPPAWRPSGLWKRHDAALAMLVEGRLDNPSTAPPDQAQQSSIQADINSMGRQLKEDLLLVVKEVKSCYPPEMDICNLYAKLYHQTLSARFRKIADFVLDDKDSTFVLRWVNEFYPGILQKPELVGEIDTEALGKLLPKELLQPLEKHYLSNEQSVLTTYIVQILAEAKEKWDKGEEPTREDGCYDSPLAYDIIQLINGKVTSAETVVGDLQKAQSITHQLEGLMHRFKVFQEDVSKQNRPNSRAFVKANLGCVEQFRDFLDRRSRLFPDDVRRNCLCVLTDMKQSAHTYLLSPVHKVLKPHYQKLGTNDWLNKNVFENLLIDMEEEIQELQGSTQSCYQELIGQLYQEVTEEYVRRLLRGEVRLKDKDRQEKAYMTVRDDAESLHKIFNERGLKDEWLKEILTNIGEVLKLQDVPALQVQVVSLGFAYPDLSGKHISALLRLKTNLSKANRKTIKATLLDTLKEASVGGDIQPFFSKLDVK
ncbi:tumor necrosis factor alpha-induced protein 2-like isoform X1 [Embiotoca jacksoni]|uniref:tumor necrosis factor alpha-induced protein 2-like isoform X1 n=2 Tax=Embiotoca jacksoni TaxID=100190 RepID=UPI0037038373